MANVQSTPELSGIENLISNGVKHLELQDNGKYAEYQREREAQSTHELNGIEKLLSSGGNHLEVQDNGKYAEYQREREAQSTHELNGIEKLLSSGVKHLEVQDNGKYAEYQREREAHSTHELNGIEKPLSSGVKHLEVQEKYILPLHERPHISQASLSEEIPVVNLKGLDGPDRSTVIEQIRRVCEQDGVFQIVNHGVPETVMKNMMEVAKEFFEMPVEDRARYYSDDPKQPTRVSTSANVSKEKVLNWRDYLTHPCQPLEEVISSWPEKPATYRETARKYAVELHVLCLKLLAAISEALGLDSDYLKNLIGENTHFMVINYYPPCPNPDLTLGIAGHTDKGSVTVLMQGDVSGLQVLKDGKWITVEPIPNAFAVHLGDQVQVVSNGRFKSVLHRAVTNSSSARISIPTFHPPSMDSFVAPAASLIDDKHPALYRGYKYGDYYKAFANQPLMGKVLLDQLKIEYPEKDR